MQLPTAKESVDRNIINPARSTNYALCEAHRELSACSWMLLDVYGGRNKGTTSCPLCSAVAFRQWLVNNVNHVDSTDVRDSSLNLDQELTIFSCTNFAQNLSVQHGLDSAPG